MPRDPRHDALRTLYRGAADSKDPSMLALEDLSDPMGEPDGDYDDLGRMDDRPLMEDETMLPGGRMVPIDDLEARGAMTEDLWRKARPSVTEAHYRDTAGAMVPEEQAGDEALMARILEQVRRDGAR